MHIILIYLERNLLSNIHKQRIYLKYGLKVPCKFIHTIEIMRDEFRGKYTLQKPKIKVRTLKRNTVFEH